MKWIRDDDEQRIRRAHVLVKTGFVSNLVVAEEMLAEVLEHIHELGQEHQQPEPRIAELTEAEQRAIYPERYGLATNGSGARP